MELGNRRTELSPTPFVFCLYGVVLLFVPSCSPPDNDYFPTTPGYEWTYDISRMVPVVQGLVRQKSIVRNLQSQRVDGLRHYPKIYANGSKYSFISSATGISRLSPTDGRGELIIGYPLSVDTKWSSAARLQLFDLPRSREGNRNRLSRNLTLDYTITSLDEAVRVPAGYFSRCLRIDAVGFLDLPRRLMLGIKSIKVEQTQWYAPGIGLIKMTRREFALPNLYPSEYTQVLTSFKQG